MDLIDHLSIKKPLTTGLAKRLESIEQEDSFALGGTGFLFNNNSVFKSARERLYGNEKDKENAQESPEHGLEDHRIAPTQKIILDYDGENLEQDFPKQRDSVESSRDNHAQKAQRRLNLKSHTIGVTSASNDATQVVLPQPDTTGDEDSPGLDTQILPMESAAECSDDDFESTKRDPTPSCHNMDIDENTLKATVQDIDANLALTASKLLSHDEAEAESREDNLSENKNMRDHHTMKKEAVAGNKFTSRNFVDGFDDSSDSDEGNANFDSDTALQTSQMDEDEVEIDIKKTPIGSSDPQNEQGLRSLKVYEGVLRQKLQEKEIIALSSSSDEETPIKTYSMGSKAAVFDLKARLSKRRQKSKIDRSKTSSASASLKTLFTTLRKANKEQIMDYRKGKLTSNGIDLAAIADEKESVESLLERELARNKRIRQRELERQKEKESPNENGDSASSDLDFSNNEFEGEVSDQDNSDIDRDSDDTYSVQDAMHGSQDIHESSKNGPKDVFTEGTEMHETDSDDDEEIVGAHEEHKRDIAEAPRTELKGRRKGAWQQEEEEEEEEGQEGEEGQEESIRLSRKSKKLQIRDTESDSEDPQQRPNKNVIDLGAYGNNIPHPLMDSSLRRTEVMDLKKTLLPDMENIEEKTLNNTTSEVGSPNTELLKMKIQKIMERQQKREAKRAMRIKKMRDGKVNEMMEMEAEESEDEWFGVGGADGEASDEHDSELEAMIDDYSHSNSNSDEIRQKLIKDDINKDKDMVNKILHDIESGGFRKRGRGALDLELSDGEDDELLKYHARRKEDFRQKLSSSALNGTALTNPRAKPFFESVVEGLDDKVNFLSEDELEIKENAGDRSTQDSIVSKKKTTLSQAFVQQTLSFLTSRDKESQTVVKEASSGILSRPGDDDGELDLHSLKQRSRIKVFSSTWSDSNVTTGDDPEQPVFERKSGTIFSRFKHHKEASEMFKEGQKTVKSATSYKVAGSSRASITYLGRARKLAAGKKAVKLRSKAARQNSSTDPLFRARNEGSFET
ncbi:chromatin-modulating protein MRC1 LALA0_S11e00144g [Lachancea lanzarotensis]|uniref:LALA0S11e00144g1_1 n=1 Tax=Lachancea lanzarotensis TaxID=1245769 RepID=A0A0C7N8M4_9SACH|nr:uncharacterized protein LALA0_S11e00144g [Lachancea lanzarotensis]CEP64262.1 LALA0S11e00144g1_1 [Lachancea lanzarotensis]